MSAAPWLVRRLIREGVDPVLAEVLATGGDAVAALAAHVLNPAGHGTGTGEWITEHPAGVINSVNEIFTTANDFSPGTVRVYLNGMRQSFPESYTTSGTNQIDLTFAPDPGDDLTVDYIKA